jgi:hypothetical protein
LVFNVRAARARRSGVFTNLSFPAQSCTSLPVDCLDLGLLHPTAQPLCSFVAARLAGRTCSSFLQPLCLPAFSCSPAPSHVVSSSPAPPRLQNRSQPRSSHPPLRIQPCHQHLALLPSLVSRIVPKHASAADLPPLVSSSSSRGTSATAFAVAAALDIHSSTVSLLPPQENAKGIIT